MGSSSSVMTSATVGNEGFVGIVPKSSNSASRKTRHAVVNSLPTKKIISVQIETLVDSVVKGMSSFTPRRLSTKPNSETSLSIPSVETLKHTEAFMDSFYIQNYLSQEEADELFECLAIIGEAQRPKDTSIANKMHSKYPLWTKYYGLARSLDGARALDRWGSYHESWTRVSEPPTALARVAERLRKTSSTQEVINSMVVNYYYDGQNTYIPAHRDTTACLQDNSIIYCLSLGATRDFILCSNEDAGKYSYNDINHVIKKYSVSHGDLFALGVKTTVMNLIVTLFHKKIMFKTCAFLLSSDLLIKAS
jgi:alkylated DNA repair dioxygenase AlkB